MKELALHILDLIQNSIRAKATTIQLTIKEEVVQNKLEIIIEDNGEGIEESLLKNITNPFSTTRTLRKVGLGIPFVASLCEMCEGDFCITSKKGEGTRVKMAFKRDHIDLLPLGNVSETLGILIMSNPSVRFIYCYEKNQQTFSCDTKVIEELLEGVPICNLEVIAWLKQYIQDGENAIKNHI